MTFEDTNRAGDRAKGALVPAFQELYARRCGQVLRRLAGPARTG